MSTSLRQGLAVGRARKALQFGCQDRSALARFLDVSFCPVAQNPKPMQDATAVIRTCACLVALDHDSEIQCDGKEQCRRAAHPVWTLGRAVNGIEPSPPELACQRQIPNRQSGII